MSVCFYLPVFLSILHVYIAYLSACIPALIMTVPFCLDCLPVCPCLSGTAYVTQAQKNRCITSPNQRNRTEWWKAHDASRLLSLIFLLEKNVFFTVFLIISGEKPDRLLLNEEGRLTSTPGVSAQRWENPLSRTCGPNIIKYVKYSTRAQEPDPVLCTLPGKLVHPSCIQYSPPWRPDGTTGWKRAPWAAKPGCGQRFGSDNKPLHHQSAILVDFIIIRVALWLSPPLHTPAVFNWGDISHSGDISDYGEGRNFCCHEKKSKHFSRSNGGALQEL